jgi:myo-inositol-1(or 4)-monophosphatase
VLGVIAAPALTRLDDTTLGTLWSGGPTLGATRASLFDPSRPTTPLAVSTVDTLERALVATGFPYDRQQTAADLVAPLLKALRRVQCVRRLGSAALDLAHLADGTFSAYWEPRLQPWDLAAGVALVRAAGGKVTDLAGGDTMLATGNVLATNGLLHTAMLTDVMVPPQPQRRP